MANISTDAAFSTDISPSFLCMITTTASTFSSMLLFWWALLLTLGSTDCLLSVPLEGQEFQSAGTKDSSTVSGLIHSWAFNCLSFGSLNSVCQLKEFILCDPAEYNYCNICSFLSPMTNVSCKLSVRYPFDYLTHWCYMMCSYARYSHNNCSSCCLKA